MTKHHTTIDTNNFDDDSFVLNILEFDRNFPSQREEYIVSVS